MGGVFWFSFLLTPLIGILVGLSSERVKRKQKSDIDKIKNRKRFLLEKIERLNKEKELGLLDESKITELEDLKKQYSSIDVEKEIREIKQKRSETISEGKKKSNRLIIYLTLIILLIFLVSYLHFHYNIFGVE